MTSIYQILEELNIENGSNYKTKVLLKHKDNKTLTRVLKMAYDNVKYVFGVGKTSLDKVEYSWVKESKITIEEALDILEFEFCSRKVTGNAAINRLTEMFSLLDSDDVYVISRVIERDLRINLGKTHINKCIKNLITKPAYMRCGVYSSKTVKDISFPAYCQLKADGTYREFTVNDGVVTSRSRSGESYDYPLIFDQMKDLQNGIYVGELVLRGEKGRAKGNGLINSDNPPHEDIIVQFWDFITVDEYHLSKEKDRKNPCTIQYSRRFERLNYLLSTHVGKNIQVIESIVVNNIEEALKFTSDVMNDGFEGSILKDFKGVFKDGTSKHQLKLKLEINVEMRCVGFHDGTRGTKREGKIGSIIFENDDRTVRGKCSGFTDKELDYYSENKEKFIGKIMEVQCNDISKSSVNDFYALSHPRFIEWRDDKDETDGIDKIFEIRNSSMCLSK